MSLTLKDVIWNFETIPLKKLILLALIDISNNNFQLIAAGSHALHKKTGISRRHVMTLLKDLQEEKVISFVGYDLGRTKVYRINLEIMGVRIESAASLPIKPLKYSYKIGEAA